MRRYFQNDFAADLKAGFITAVVALPLAIAFAIASGVTPQMGLYTAVIAGLIGSVAGGSRFSITGPTGAMTVIVLVVVHKFGIEGLLVCGFFAGLIQLLLGALRFGAIVKFIPLPVISGFTCGIGLIIFIGQLPSLFGLEILPQEHVWETMGQFFAALQESKLAAVLVSGGTIAILLILPKYLARLKLTQSIPASMIALLCAVGATHVFGLNISLVGEIPSELPSFKIPSFDFKLVRELLPSAFTIALLGSVEALLCAVVCDGMTGTKHDSNRELIGQGLANVVLPWFGGIAATAAIARSAVNVREGARTRMSGVYHALILLLTLLYLGPVARLIPHAFLAGILVVVSLRMINLKEFKVISSISRSDTLVFAITLILTVLTDIIFAVQLGMVFAIFLFFVRIVNLMEVRSLESEEEDGYFAKLIQNDADLREKFSVYTIYGPFFFGAMSIFDQKLDAHMSLLRPITILRMKFVPFIDSTGVQRLKEFIREHDKKKSLVVFSGLTKQVESQLLKDPEFSDLVEQKRIFEHTSDALAEKDRLLSLT